jgi:hypothetical protein
VFPGPEMRRSAGDILLPPQRDRRQDRRCFSASCIGSGSPVGAREVDQLLVTADIFDGCAGHVVYVARTRGWPALSADPDRLHRVDPAIKLDLL